MTAALAIAATTEVLRYIVAKALKEAEEAFDLPELEVKTGAPPRPSGADDPEVVNLFLHAVAPNAALRNPGPARDAAGRRIDNAPLVLNLQYLLSAHGPEAVREIGLGTAMHALHQLGIVPRPVIRDAIASLDKTNKAMKAIAENERLADQLDSLTISTLPQDIDALTKLWNATQAPLRPAANYLVTTVYLEQDRPQVPALPVLSTVLAPATMRALGVRSVAGRKGGREWPLTADADLVIEGEGMGERDLEPTLGGIALERIAAESGPQRLVARIPGSGVPELRAGTVGLALRLSGDVGGTSRPLQTATVNVSLRPSPSRAAGPPVPDTAPPNGGTVTGNLPIAVTPPVGARQRATLRLARVDGTEPSVAVSWDPPTSGSGDAFTVLVFKLNKVRRGDYLLQLEVDGVMSQPMPDAAGVFQPRVTL